MTSFWSRFRRKPLGVAALAWLLLVAIASILAPVLAPFGADEQDLTQVLSAPTSQHLLGTGALGRDILSRLLYGGQVTLLGALISCAIYVAVGLPLGVWAGYAGGIVERVVLRLADLVYAVPAIIVLLVVVAIFPGNETAAMVALGLLGAPGLARVVRSVTRELREELFVRAARISGLGPTKIMRRHILPRVLGTVIVQTSLFAAAAVLLETGLGFLGVGTDQASWGGLIAEASSNLGIQPWLLVPSGLVVILFVLSLGLVGDAVRDTVAERSGAVRRSRPRRTRGGNTARSRADNTKAIDTQAGDPLSRDALLSVRGLTVAFDTDDGPLSVVTDVDLDVMPGEAVGILGESGCGKSITARAVNGLLPAGGRVVSGSVHFEGRDLTTLSDAALRTVRGARIGWISQEPINSLDPSFTVGAQVAEAVQAHRRCSRAEARRRAVELLTIVKLPDPAAMAKRYPHQLSGGQAQRVGIAAALAADPVLLIADEPTTALDVTVQADILDLLRDLQEGGLAIVLVTHDWGVLADLCQRAVVMYAGEVVEQATVADLVAAPRHPYTAGLLAANPHTAVRGQALTAIDGSVPPPADWPTGCRFRQRCPLATPECATAPVSLEAVDGDRAARCLHQIQSTPTASALPEAVHS